MTEALNRAPTGDSARGPGVDETPGPHPLTRRRPESSTSAHATSQASWFRFPRFSKSADKIAAIHAETRQRYGSPRIHAELGERGCRTGRKRVARLMRVRGLAARRRRLVSGHDAVAASVSHRPQRPGAAIRAYWAGPGVGHRHHLHSDGR